MERQKKKIERMRGNKKDIKAQQKKASGSEKTNRAGFEGKKGPSYLNAKKQQQQQQQKAK